MDENESRSINRHYKEIFERNNVRYLVHANTVQTSLSFLKAGKLLSRQAMEDLGFPQTPQNSDEFDKDVGIYNDIFLDSVDICNRIGEANKYGPVLFCFNLNALDDLEVPIKITRNNPCSDSGYWTAETPDEERYFTSPEEYAANFEFGSFGHHVTIPDTESLAFDHLAYILLDEPELLAGINDSVHELLSSSTRKKVCKRNIRQGFEERFEDSYRKLPLPELEKRFCLDGQKLAEDPGRGIVYLP